jgi:hypothetical protein
MRDPSTLGSEVNPTFMQLAKYVNSSRYGGNINVETTLSSLMSDICVSDSYCVDSEELNHADCDSKKGLSVGARVLRKDFVCRRSLWRSKKGISTIFVELLLDLLGLCFDFQNLGIFIAVSLET